LRLLFFPNESNFEAFGDPGPWEKELNPLWATRFLSSFDRDFA